MYIIIVLIILIIFFFVIYVVGEREVWIKFPLHDMMAISWISHVLLLVEWDGKRRWGWICAWLTWGCDAMGWDGTQAFLINRPLTPLMIPSYERAHTFRGTSFDGTRPKTSLSTWVPTEATTLAPPHLRATCYEFGIYPFYKC